MRTVLIVLAVATWYAGPYQGEPLFCGGAYVEGTAPWVALPYETYGEEWQCGDLIYVSFGQGDAMLVRAMDTGPFGKHCVMQPDGECIPIAVDIPRPLWPRALEGDLSAKVRVTNITGLCREAGVCDED